MNTLSGAPHYVVNWSYLSPEHAKFSNYNKNCHSFIVACWICPFFMTFFAIVEFKRAVSH